MKLNFKNNRSESRLFVPELELISFKLNRLVINAIVEDKSNSGMGCYCSGDSPLKVNDVLNLWDIVLYKICWINKLTASVKNFGLLIIEEL